MPIILSLDIGTSKLAAVAFDSRGRRNVAVLSTANSATVPGLPSGLHEQDPRSIYRDCLGLLGGLLESGRFAPGDVAGIALSGQMHGLLLVDPALEPLTNLITWCDQRAAGVCAGLDRATWPAGRSGCYLHPGYGGATLAWLAAEGRIPEGALALGIADYVAAMLCGEAATELTQAAAWGIADLRRGAWDEELLARLSIPRGVLPELRSRSRGLGRLRAGPDGVRGLPAGLPVCPPVGDNQASYIGSGADLGAGAAARAVLLNLGTGGQISIPSEALVFKAELETRPLPAGGYLLVGASLCGGRSYAILKDFFRATLREFAGREAGDAELYEVMNRLAAAPAGKESPRVDTRFAGTRMDPSLRGGIESIGIDSLNPAALCRGVALGMVRELTELVPAELRPALGRVLASGNAVRANPLVQRLISEELGLPCELSTEREEAATGAAIVAARAVA